MHNKTYYNFLLHISQFINLPQILLAITSGSWYYYPVDGGLRWHHDPAPGRIQPKGNTMRSLAKRLNGRMALIAAGLAGVTALATACSSAA